MFVDLCCVGDDFNNGDCPTVNASALEVDANAIQRENTADTRILIENDCIMVDLLQIISEGHSKKQ